MGGTAAAPCEQSLDVPGDVVWKVSEGQPGGWGSHPHAASMCRSGAHQPQARMRACLLGQGYESNCSQ